MDPIQNPYAPGAGTPPPELAGRETILERGSIVLHRLGAGRPERSLVFHGLRGVGKTVLLNRIRLAADAEGFAVHHLEAVEGRSLPALLAPALRSMLIRLSRVERARDAAHRGLRVLTGFIEAMKVSYQDITLQVDTGIDPEHGVADSGDLELDMADLLLAVGKAAQARGSSAALFLDEMQYIRIDELGALIAALHNATQQQVPITVLGAGLPQLLGRLGKAKSYAERLFEYVQIDSLAEEDAREAIVLPAERLGVRYTEDALRGILDQTRGYPYFLQVWGKHCWDLAETSPIDHELVIAATELARSELDSSFFQVRFDRLTPNQRRYLRAMAELGDGPHRSGDIADVLGRSVEKVAPVRSELISKGMVYSPAHGDTAFTVPLFAGFMKRMMPDLE